MIKQEAKQGERLKKQAASWTELFRGYRSHKEDYKGLSRKAVDDGDRYAVQSALAKRKDRDDEDEITQDLYKGIPIRWPMFLGAGLAPSGSYSGIPMFGPGSGTGTGAGKAGTGNYALQTLHSNAAGLGTTGLESLLPKGRVGSPQESLLVRYTAGDGTCFMVAATYDQRNRKTVLSTVMQYVTTLIERGMERDLAYDSDAGYSAKRDNRERGAYHAARGINSKRKMGYAGLFSRNKGSGKGSGSYRSHALFGTGNSYSGQGGKGAG